MFLVNNTDTSISFKVDDIQIILESGEIIFYNPFSDSSQEVAKLVRDGYLFLYDEDDSPEDILEELNKNINISKKTIKNKKNFSNLKFNNFNVDE